MQQVYEVIQLIRATASKNEKLAILKANQGNAELKQYLYLVYESSQSYYMTKIAKSETINPFCFNIDTLTELCQKLHTRSLSGNKAKDYVAQVYQGLNEWEKDLLLCIVDRDIKAGMNVSSVNKTWPEFLTEVPYMRCSLLKDAKLSTWDFSKGVFSQIKADGMFSNFNNTSLFKTLTRAGNSLPTEYIEHLIQDFAQLPMNMQYHGECLVVDKETNQILSRKEGNGLLNSALKSGEFDKTRYLITVKIWDALPLSEAKVGKKYKVSYRERFTQLEQWVKQANMNSVSLAENRVVYSLEEAQQHFIEATSQGLEGTILKHPDLLIWEDTTSKYQIKFKIKAECELRIKEFVYGGKGKNKELFRSLRCHSEDELLIVDVSGFTDAERKAVMEKGDEIIDQIIAVEFNDIISQRGTHIKSLFLPIALEIRLDKKTADTLPQIEAIFQEAKYNILK